MKMKCAIRCESLLLRKAVEKFLRGHVTSVNEADVIVADAPYESPKAVLVLQKPFTKEELFYQIDHLLEKKGAQLVQGGASSPKWEHIEAKVERLTMAYVKKLMEIVRENYERH